MSYKFCPHCGETLPPDLPDSHGSSFSSLPAYVHGQEKSQARKENGPCKYNQTLHWRELIAQARSAAGSTDAPVVTIPNGFTGGTTIIHFVFKDSVSPQGGLMHDLIRSTSATQQNTQSRLTKADLSAMGYLSDDSGKVVLVDDVPVGPIYGIFQYWGGDKQHKRWHMKMPVIVHASRNGDPCFIDDSIAAIKVAWKDGDRLAPAIHALADLLEDGVKGGKGVGRPVLINVCWVE